MPPKGYEFSSIHERLVAKSVWDNGHLRWTGKKSHNGYGNIKYKGKTIRVHRLSAHLFLDFDLESELLVLHKPSCPYRDCWNSNCLYIGTQKENIQDAINKGTYHFGTENLNGGKNFNPEIRKLKYKQTMEERKEIAEFIKELPDDYESE